MAEPTTPTVEAVEKKKPGRPPAFKSAINKQSEGILFKMIPINGMEKYNPAAKNGFGGGAVHTLKKRHLIKVYNDEISEWQEREIRYKKGQNSIFVDEQGKNTSQSDGFMPDDQTYVEFKGGELWVSRKNTALIKFLRACPDNKDSENYDPSRPALFFEHSPEKDSATNMKDFEKKKEAQKICFNLDVETWRKIARNIPELRGEARSFGIKEIEYQVCKFADEKPSEFLRIHSDPSMPIVSCLYDALDLNILDDSFRNNTIVWSDTKKVVKEWPEGKNSIEFVSNWMVTTSEGKTFYTELNKLVSAKLG